MDLQTYFRMKIQPHIQLRSYYSGCHKKVQIHVTMFHDKCGGGGRKKKVWRRKRVVKATALVCCTTSLRNVVDGYRGVRRPANFFGVSEFSKEAPG